MYTHNEKELNQPDEEELRSEIENKKKRSLPVGSACSDLISYFFLFFILPTYLSVYVKLHSDTTPYNK